MPQLSASLNHKNLPDSAKLKKVWNFIKGDIHKILVASSLSGNIQITEHPDGSFLIDFNSHQHHDEIIISYDLSFANELIIEGGNTALQSLILALLIRIEQTHRKAFRVSCNYYPIVDGARKILLTALNMKATHNMLCAFINYPVPGKRPIKERALTTSEATERYAQKRTKEGKVQLKSWIQKDTKMALDAYCKLKGITIQKALNEVLPLGLNIGTYLITKENQSQNKAI